jgi:4'-phosphopantetheinyl transferase
MRLTLSPDARVSVRWLRTEAFDDARVAAVAWANLGREERAAFVRMRPGTAWRDKLAAHALARRMIADRAGCRPADLRLRTSRHGRPVLLPPRGSPRLDFSIAASDGLVVCAVASGCTVGADVESLENAGPNPLAVAAGVCSARELRRLIALPARRRRAAFVRMWTMKEAVLKATGLGLRVPPEAVTVDPALHFDGALRDDPARWRLVTARPTPRHATAIAVRTGRIRARCA